MKTYVIDYVVGNTYKTKEIIADSIEEAIKKSRLTTSIVDINIKEYMQKDKYLLRDF